MLTNPRGTVCSRIRKRFDLGHDVNRLVSKRGAPDFPNAAPLARPFWHTELHTRPGNRGC